MRNRGSMILASGLAIFLLFWLLLSSPSQSPSMRTSNFKTQDTNVQPSFKVDEAILEGGSIMPHLGNETLKAELGRASWKLFHTTLARFPTKPSEEDRDALRTYIHLFARLYPCGECGTHFQALLRDFPPQTSGREAASQWGCYVHNKVNERLKKPEFDCAAVAEHYKCGCADTDEEATNNGGGEKEKPRYMRKKQGASGNPGNPLGLTLEKEGLTKGG